MSKKSPRRKKLKSLTIQWTANGTYIKEDDGKFNFIASVMMRGKDYTRVLAASVDLLKAARATVNLLRLHKRRSKASLKHEEDLLELIRRCR